MNGLNIFNLYFWVFSWLSKSMMKSEYSLSKEISESEFIMSADSINFFKFDSDINSISLLAL